MLALTRKRDEAIIINNNIEVKIIEVKGDQVKLGISAPKSVPVYRKEVYEQVQQANRAAAEELAGSVEALKKMQKDIG